MRPVRLTPRLQAIADAVSGETLADIGTDHAYLPAYLLQNGKIARAIAADLRAGPLARAKVTARDAGCADRMDFRLCDGLRGLHREEADTVVIAGMGGETITHILAQAPWTDWTGMQLLLQPMSTQPELRRWLWETGFVISWEKLVQEGDTLYVIQGVEPGREKDFTPAELWAGRQSRDPLRGAWLDHLLRKSGRALEGVRQGRETCEKQKELELVYEGMLEMRKEWNTWQR